MPDNEEERKSTAGIVTPNASKDDEWRREVGGVFTFVDEAGGSGNFASPLQSPCFSPIFSPVNPRIVGMM